MISRFIDGLKSLSNSLINSRAATNTNTICRTILSESELREIYSTGLPNKIFRIKTGAALSDTLIFDSEETEEIYKDRLNDQVMDACKFMLAFGRGTIVVFEKGDDLSKPLKVKNKDRLQVRVFSGDIITVSQVSLDLMNARYLKPQAYNIKSSIIHHSRVVDFTYIKPVEVDAPRYQYGGISESELIYPQLVADGIIERSIPSIVDKNASMFYKVKGFKEAVRAKKESEMINYYGIVEDMRSVMGATILDDEDQAEVISQTLSNLSDVDTISLRRLSMVTGIPLPYLVGEAVQGLNSSGSTERAVFGDMIEALQNDYLLRPLQRLFDIFELGTVDFEDTQGLTQSEEMVNETSAVDNAVKLASIGEDFNAYLLEKGVVKNETSLFDSGLYDDA